MRSDLQPRSADPAPPPVRRRRRRSSEAAARVAEAAARRQLALTAAAAARRLDALPDVPTLREIAAFYRMGTSTIRRKLANGTWPYALPFAMHPYRWNKADIVRHVRSGMKRDAQLLADARARRRRKRARPQ